MSRIQSRRPRTDTFAAAAAEPAPARGSLKELRAALRAYDKKRGLTRRFRHNDHLFKK